MNRDSLIKRIESKRDDLVDLTCQLVRIPTINPPGDAYTDCARLLGERLKKKNSASVFIAQKELRETVIVIQEPILWPILKEMGRVLVCSFQRAFGCRGTWQRLERRAF